MPLDKDRNRILVALRDRPEGLKSSALVEALGLPREEVERHLLYCADYGLATWVRKTDGAGLATITDRGRDYLVRQKL
jgi:DNA-binding transcriptional ArsR family regulator